MMDLDQLQSVRDRERQTDKLQQLRESFYADAAELVADLREERDRAAEEAEDPFDDPRVGRLTDQINTAEQTVEAIYEKRVGKLVKAASFAAADLPAETEGMTAEERDLFDSLVEDIRTNRQRVLDVLAGETGPGPGDGGQTAEGSSGTDAVDAASLMGGEAEDAPPPPPTPADPAGPTETDEDGSGEGIGDASGDGIGEGGSDGIGAGNSDSSGDGSEGADTADPSGSETAGSERGTGDGDAGDSAASAGSDDGIPAPPDDVRASADSSDDASDQDRSAGDGSDAGVGETRDGGNPEGDAGEGDEDLERMTVRITRDVGEVFGVDQRAYDLEAEQVVDLPAANAEPLLDQNAAERVE